MPELPKCSDLVVRVEWGSAEKNWMVAVVESVAEAKAMR